ncbi:cytochrome b/b6 domain-containing protein [Rhizobium paknamense]|uniref:Cytochrome b561 n=1 Tax=Rhizobium paknamense TaxID=1206817 RepID=A0ABU0IE03_9HYPH|nr:YceI family protein [Rhizobium paknamense]MDQ0455439.1 cytochrome b561 [Rhizobium paknamense]
MNMTYRPDANSRKAQRYSRVAILLHWAIALLILSMIPMGWWMVRAINSPDSQQTAYQAFQLHKSIGFAILALTVLRIVWRLTHRPPPLPANMKGWEVFLAHATHMTFYAFMLAMPLTGWLYVSSGWAIATDKPLEVATSWFGLFTIPHLPGLEANRSVAFGAMGAHAWMAYGGAVLIALHVAAALKHHVIERDGVLAQMLPFFKQRAEKTLDKPAGAVSALAGFAALAVLALAGIEANRPAPLSQAALQAMEPAAEDAAPQAAAPGPTLAPAQSNATPAPASGATAPTWTIDKAKSSIAFSGTHAGKAFQGRFEDWSADIHFDPANLATSRAVVTVKTLSAKTGDPTQEGSLKNGEWFNSARFPDAVFTTTGFKSLGGERYEAEGTLTLKNKPVPVTLPFTLTMTGGKAHMEGSLQLSREALNLGMFSDPAAEWVSKMIDVKITVDADKAASP